MKRYTKIPPEEWIGEWGLTWTEGAILADMLVWDCTLIERAERCFVTEKKVRQAIKKFSTIDGVKELLKSGTKFQKNMEQSSTLKRNKVPHQTEQSSTFSKEKKKIPPTPPIKNKKKIQEDITLDKSNVPNADASAGKKTSQKKEKKEDPKVYTIQHRCRTFFENIYEQKKGDKYYYAAKDAAALKQLLNKIKFLMPEDQKTDEAKLEENYQIFINTIFHSKILGAWITDNLSLPIINDKFNEIYSQLKNGKSRQQQQQAGPTDEYLRRVAAEVEANGGLAF